MSYLTKMKYVFPIGMLALVICLALGLVVAGLVWADPDEGRMAVVVAEETEAVLPIDPRAEIIAMSCAACHGTEGRKASAIPALAGKPFPVLNALLLAFKQDQMPDATVMPRLAKGYTDAELKAVAEYFSSLSAE